MSFATIAVMILICYGFGLSITSLVKAPSSFFERHIMRFGIGLSLFGSVGMLLDLLHLPLDWRLFLLLAWAYPVFLAVKNKGITAPTLKITKSDLFAIGAILIFAFNAHIHLTGAFNYPYLENDDSWGHAQSVKYASVEQDISPGFGNKFHYIDPYPPTYAIILGTLHQTNDSVHWTLKVINGLFVSLAVLFFYFFMVQFSRSSGIALISSFALLAIPAFLSHFIWALSLSVTLYFVTFYCFEKIREDKRWWIIAGVVMITTLSSSPTHSTYFGLLFALYFLTKFALSRKIPWKEGYATMIGLAGTFLLWLLPAFITHGTVKSLQTIGILSKTGAIRSVAGTGDRVYTFNDFFVAKEQNMINNPIGIGVALCILLVIGIGFVLLKNRALLKSEHHWKVISIAWLLLGLYAVNATNFAVKLSPFRAWMVLAIPVCILAGYGLYRLAMIGKGAAGIVGLAVVLILGGSAIYNTSLHQKIAVNTATWPPGAFWTSGEELSMYIWMKDNLGPDTPVFSFSNPGATLGMDKYMCMWCAEDWEYYNVGINNTARETHQFLKQRNYDYLLIDGQTFRKHGNNDTNRLLQDISQSGLFSVRQQNQGAILLGVT